MDYTNEIHFVNVRGPDQDCNVAYTKTSRQHVRRAVMRKRNNGDFYDKIRHFNGLKFLNGVTAPKLPQNRLLMTEAICESQTNDSSQRVPQGSLQTPAHYSGKCRTSCHMELPRPLTSMPTTWHPYTVYAASCVQMPVNRIDFFFKSCMAHPSYPSHVLWLIRDRCISQCCGASFRYESH